MSAILPKGIRNIAAANRYEVATQLNTTAFMANSLAMVGSAILTEELIKGVRKELNVAISKAVLLLTALFVLILPSLLTLRRSGKL